MTTITQAFQHGGVQGLLQNETFTTVTTLALCLIIGYVVYSMLLARIPIFQDREQRLGKPGKIISLCLSGITLAAAYKYLAVKGGFAKIANHLLTSFGTIGGGILMAATFLATFKRKEYPSRTTNWKLSLILTGLTGMLYAGITSNQFIAILGCMLFFLPIIAYIAEGHEHDDYARRRYRR